MTAIDTTFLVAWELAEHPRHADARACLGRLLAAGEQFVITPAIVAEFIHVVTDAKRFQTPLTMDHALTRAAFWRSAKEVFLIEADDTVLNLFERWMRQHHLGRKRILDTMLAATVHQHGARSILTLNSADFAIFGVFSFPLT